MRRICICTAALGRFISRLVSIGMRGEERRRGDDGRLARVLVRHVIARAVRCDALPSHDAVADNWVSFRELFNPTFVILRMK